MDLPTATSLKRGIQLDLVPGYRQRKSAGDQIEIDGIAGAQTRQAIEEFQSLFRLMATGQPDARTEAKMREIGLIN